MSAPSRVLHGVGVIAATGLWALLGSHTAQAAALATLKAADSAPIASFQVLSAADAGRYAQAFSAMRRGDVVGGQNAARGIVDPCLLGRLQAIRLLNPNYRANYTELKAWLEQNGDLPEAARVYDLALKRKPRGESDPRAPSAAVAVSDGRTALDARAERGPPPVSPAANGRQQAARNAFYRGDIDQAYALASESGERWIAGLAAVRLNRYPDALRNLSELASDARQNTWVRSAAAYWASRAATASADTPRAHDLLKIAARSPDTFYGLIAARELDQQAARTAQTAAVDPIADVLAAEAVDPQAVASFAHADARAHRAAALMQIGSPIEAGEDLRLAFAGAAPAERAKLTSLAIALNAPLGKPDVAKAGWARFDMGHFPTPQLFPKGGFTVDKALVYALVNQESRFNPDIVSGSGAYGLMQLTAETAARLAGDEGLRHDPRALRDPALNLRLGQDYVAKLLATAKGDVMRAVAGYNAGPGVIKSMVAKMGENADSLMMIESLPSGQTRDYVQRVMAGYWIYRQIFGQDSRTLDAAALGLRAVASADR